MTAATIPRTSEQATPPRAIESLRARLAGRLIVPGDDDYDSTRHVWNSAVNQRPAAIVRCAEPADAAWAVVHAREHGLPITVRSGGHSFAGFGVRDGALMIDLSQLRKLRVLGGRRVATAQPGLTWGEFNRGTAACGLATTGADISTVGIAGMTLGGGMGWLHRVFGAACDNLLGADVVLADGRAVRASAESEPDLYWALRGGGGNFGIVTSLDYRLHPLDDIVGGITLHPIERARDALKLYRELCARAPDELRLAVFLITAPPARFIPEYLRGRPCVMMCAAYFGPVSAGEAAVRPVQRFGPPAVNLIRRMRYEQLEHRAPPEGMHHFGTGEFLSALDDRTIDAIADAAAHPVSPFIIILVNQLGGAFGRVADGETPFGLRQAAHTVGIHCMWQPGDSPDRHEAWTRMLWSALLPASAGGAAVNLQGDEGPERVRAAYGPRVFARLREIKRRYDPDNVFRVNANIPPAEGA